MADKLEVPVDNLMKERTRATVRERLFGVEAETLKVGRFVILDVVGSGAMGTVYAAYDPDLDRKVAVKLIRSDLSKNEVSRQRLIREARAMAKLSHPNVISVHDVGTVDDTVFFAMELVDGGNVREWLAREPRSWRQIVDVFVQAGRGLKAAHSAGLIHRDFKPDNVLVRKSGRVQVLDFGVAWVVDSPDDLSASVDSADFSQERNASLTRTGGLVGTPRYMAPEQHAAAPTDPRTDQFSFCVAMWEALYREPPFKGESLVELTKAVLAGQVSEPSNEHGTPKRFRRILERGLRASPDERYQSMRELLADLNHDPGKTRRAVAVAALCVVAVGVGIFGLTRSSSPAPVASACGVDSASSFWDAARTTKLRQGLVEAGGAGAHVIAARAAVELDRYVVSWAKMYNKACVAGERKQHSQQMLDRRMACLADRRVHFEALTRLFQTPDKALVKKAVHAVLALPAVDRCGDLQALSKRVAPAEDPQVRARVSTLRVETARLSALMSGGRYKDGLQAATRLAASIKDLTYPPFVAETMLLLGRFEDKRGNFAAARKHLERAYFLGLSAKHDEVAGEAAAMLVLIVGVRLENHAEALVWVKHATSVVTRFNANGVLAAFLLESKASLLLRYGDHAGAEDAYKEAVKLRQASGGMSGLGLAAALNGLAQVVEGRGRFDEAMKYHERALKITESELGVHHPNTVVSLNGLAVSLAKRGEFKRAKPLMKVVLARMEVAFGKQHTNVGHALNSLGIVNWRLGDFTEALAFYQRSLALKEQAVGKDHVTIGGVLNNMGLVLQPMGRLKEALAVYERSAAIDRKHLKPDHPRMANNKNNLAGVYRAMGKLELARTHYQQALAVLRKAHGPKHPSVAHSLNGLGSVYLRKRDYANARKHYEQALAIWTAAYGPDKAILAHPHANLGNVFSSLKKYPEAKKHYERAAALWSKHQGPTHPYTTDMLTALGNLYRKWGKPVKALELFEQALVAKTKRLGSSDHPDLAYVFVGKGDTLVDLKRYAEAVVVLRRAVAIRSKEADEPARLGEAQFSLAHAVLATGDKRAAVELARKARANYKKGEQSTSKIDAWLAKQR